MNTHKTIPLILSIVLAGVTLLAGEERKPGPNGGLLLDTDPQAEFFVNDDRRVEITFLDANLEPVDPGKRLFRVTALTPSGRSVLEFEKDEEHTLLSDEALPEGDGYTLVVQFYETADARPQNFRVVYEDHTCGGCDLKEYACICDH